MKQPSWWRRPALTWAVIAIVLYLVVILGHAFLPEAKDAQGQPAVDAPDVLAGWLHFDSGWYVSIADGGYGYVKGQQSSVAFFPGYPLAMRAVSQVTGSTAVAGLVVTGLSGLAVALLWWRWIAIRVRAPARLTVFLLLLLYPYAWYLYGSDYGDALFLACVLGAFVLVERDHLWLAALVGAVATATRPVGPAVVIGLIAVAVERSGALRRDAATDGRRRLAFDRSRLRPGHVGLVLSASGLVAYCAYLWSRFGDPVAFLSVQSAPGWDQGAGPRTWFKLQFFDLLFGGHAFVVRLFPPAIATVFFLVMVPFVWRRFGWGYGVYTAAVVLIPSMGSGDFQGMARYLLAAFPVFALVGEWLAESVVRRRAALSVGGVGLIVGAALFSSGFYLA